MKAMKKLKQRCDEILDQGLLSIRSFKEYTNLYMSQLVQLVLHMHLLRVEFVKERGIIEKDENYLL